MMKHRKNMFCVLLIAVMLLLSACREYVPPVEYLDLTPELSLMRVEYWSFETCIGRANNIVQAKYVGKTTRSGYLYLEFELVEQIKGQIDTETFMVGFHPYQRVTVDKYGLQYSENPDRYEEGKEYLLILEKHVSVYNEWDRYRVLCDIYIPVDEFAAASMYGGRTLSEFADGAKQADGNYEQMVAYILDEAATSTLEPISGGTDYIRTDNLPEIAEGTEHIFRVKVIDYLNSSVDYKKAWYKCKVVEVLKGEPAGEEIEIVFFANSIKVGKEYVVLLAKNEENTYYTLSSKNSVHPVSDKESLATIKNAIAGE